MRLVRRPWRYGTEGYGPAVVDDVTAASTLAAAESALRAGDARRAEESYLRALGKLGPFADPRWCEDEASDARTRAQCHARLAALAFDEERYERSLRETALAAGARHHALEVDRCTGDDIRFLITAMVHSATVHERLGAHREAVDAASVAMEFARFARTQDHDPRTRRSIAAAQRAATRLHEALLARTAAEAQARADGSEAPADHDDDENPSRTRPVIDLTDERPILDLTDAGARQRLLATAAIDVLGLPDEPVPHDERMVEGPAPDESFADLIDPDAGGPPLGPPDPGSFMPLGPSDPAVETTTPAPAATGPDLLDEVVQAEAWESGADQPEAGTPPALLEGPLAPLEEAPDELVGSQLAGPELADSPLAGPQAELLDPQAEADTAEADTAEADEIIDLREAPDEGDEIDRRFTQPTRGAEQRAQAADRLSQANDRLAQAASQLGSDPTDPSSPAHPLPTVATRPIADGQPEPEAARPSGPIERRQNDLASSESTYELLGRSRGQALLARMLLGQSDSEAAINAHRAVRTATRARQWAKEEPSAVPEVALNLIEALVVRGDVLVSTGHDEVARTDLRRARAIAEQLWHACPSSTSAAAAVLVGLRSAVLDAAGGPDETDLEKLAQADQVITQARALEFELPGALIEVANVLGRRQEPGHGLDDPDGREQLTMLGDRLLDHLQSRDDVTTDLDLAPLLG